MGNCCGSRKKNRRVVREYDNEDYEDENYEDGKYRLPKVIVTSEDTALIYFDVSPTYASDGLKYSLKRKFPNLVLCDGENRILNRMETMKERKYYLIIPGYIRKDTLRSLVNSPRVKAIYFCVEKMDFSHHSKIKGFFQNELDLERAIYYDMRSDEAY